MQAGPVEGAPAPRGPVVARDRARSPTPPWRCAVEDRQPTLDDTKVDAKALEVESEIERWGQGLTRLHKLSMS